MFPLGDAMVDQYAILTIDFSCQLIHSPNDFNIAMTTDTKTTTLNVDIVIVGGGIAGLWLLNRLHSAGYHAILFEQGELGGGQTIASQGMIHGGIKYALGGALTGASEAIAAMPDRWRRCLRGEGDVDLSDARILSEHFYMWSTQSIASRITSFFASKISQGRVDEVKASERPAIFDHKQFRGSLYKLIDLVLDVPSLISALTTNVTNSLYSIDWSNSHFRLGDNGAVDRLEVHGKSGIVSIKAQQFVLTAGEGNGQLLSQLGVSSPVMQLRPLRQVLLKHPQCSPLYAHCMGSNPSPRLTVSSHQTNSGDNLWYLGGDLATQGVDISDEDLISKARREVDELFPWLDFSGAQWRTYFINRAEPKQKGLIKPDRAFAATAQNCDNVIVGWPTKLTLAPNLSDAVFELLKTKNIVPQQDRDPIQQPLFTSPIIAEPIWESLFK